MHLTEYLKTHNIKRSHFAARIGVTPSMITEYCEGRMWPGREKMRAIAEQTDNKVTANDFVADRDGAAA